MCFSFSLREKLEDWISKKSAFYLLKQFCCNTFGALLIAPPTLCTYDVTFDLVKCHNV